MIRNIDPFEGFRQDIFANFYQRLLSVFLLPVSLFFIYWRDGNIDSFLILVAIFALFYAVSAKYLFSRDFTLVILFGLVTLIAIPYIYQYFHDVLERMQNINKLFLLVSMALLLALSELKSAIASFKTWLLKRYSEKFNFYIPAEGQHYWLPADPIRDTYYMSDTELIDINSEINFISIKRSHAENTHNAYQPIFFMTLCEKLLSGPGERQHYFHMFYGGLILLNFLYFFGAIVFVRLLKMYGVQLDFLGLLLAFSLLILFGLWYTIYVFTKNIQIRECQKITISDTLATVSNEVSTDNIDEHYLTLHGGKKVDQESKIKNLDQISEELISKLDSIYQIVTPLIFLAQVSITIAAINYLFPAKVCP